MKAGFKKVKITLNAGEKRQEEKVKITSRWPIAKPSLHLLLCSGFINMIFKNHNAKRLGRFTVILGKSSQCDLQVD